MQDLNIANTILVVRVLGAFDGSDDNDVTLMWVSRCASATHSPLFPFLLFRHQTPVVAFSAEHATTTPRMLTLSSLVIVGASPTDRG
jgi:hypothetical protein